MTLARRSFLKKSATCACHLALAASVMPVAARKLWAAESLGQVVAREPFGTLEEVADGVWAVISRPLEGDRTTLANGGLIAGKNAVLAVEGFNQPAGAQWLAAKSLELTGMRPTHVVLTHHHGDHANGIAGFQAGGASCAVHSTAITRDIVLGRDAKAADFIEELIYKQEPMASALRLMCLSRCKSHHHSVKVCLSRTQGAQHLLLVPEMLKCVTFCQCHQRRAEEARFLQTRAGTVIRARGFACRLQSREGRIAAQGCQGLVAVDEEGESHPPCPGAHTCMMR